MAQVFTNDEFKGIEFRCTEADANVGWYHVCEAVEVATGKVLVTNRCHYYNRTWESYKYQSVYESTMDKLRREQEAKAELNYDFFNELVDNDYIQDFGEDRDDDFIIIFDSCSQSDKFDSLVKDTLKRGRATKQLQNLMDETGLTRKEIKAQLDLIVCTAYTDEYSCCDHCGKWFNQDELRFVESEYEYICEDCYAENIGDFIDGLIEEAQEDFNKALSATTPESAIEDKGFTFIDNNGYDFAYRMCESDDVPKAQLIHSIFNAVVLLTGVGQFQTYFKIAVPDEYIVVADLFNKGKITEDIARQFVDGELTEEEVEDLASKEELDEAV